jgi:predicted DCC family thiol-disulfide oxidoreductase YuxK
MNIRGPILLFDGDCNLCDFMVSFVIRHDTSKKIRFSPLHSDTGKSLLERCGLSGDYSKSAVYIKDNKYFIRSSAILNIFKDLGGRWSLLYGLIIVPALLRDFLYNIIARLRHRIFGKRISCAISKR